MVTRGEGWGGGIDREFGIDMYTLLYLKWITKVASVNHQRQAKKGVNVLAGVIHPDHQGETGVLLHNGSQWKTTAIQSKQDY